MNRVIWVVAGGFAVGIFYAWLNPYNSPEIAGINVRTLLMTASSVLAFLLVYFEYHGLLKTALFISIGVGAAILCRIIFDITFVESSMHNLAPFELLIGAGLAFITAIIGGLLGTVARKAAGPPKES